MLNKIFTAVLIAGVIACFTSVLVLSNANKTLQTEKIALINTNSDQKYELQRSKEKYVQMIFSENSKVDDIELVNSDLKNVPLSTITKNKKLVYRFYESTCVQCVEDELKILKKIEDKIGQQNTIVIADFEQMNRLKSIINRIGLKGEFFSYRSKMNISIDDDPDHSISTFFVLNPDLTVDLVYKAGGSQHLEDPYYQRIISYFNENK